jgi:hypothetical protein
MGRQLALLLLALTLTVSINVSAESPRTPIGLLTCTLDDEAGRGAGRDMSCAFAPSASPTREQKYAGAVHGLATGAPGKQVLIWTVVARAGTAPAVGLLEQRYVREKSAGHPPHWAGELNSEISLQFQNHGSAELGSSITSVELRAEATRV